jgi:tight adherence protein B
MSPKLMGAMFAVLSTGGLMYAFVYPYLSGDIKAQKRQAALTSASATRNSSRANLDQAKRRKAITDSLGEAEGKAKKVDLEQRIQQAGLDISKTTYFLASAACGLVLGVAVFMTIFNAIAAVGALLVGAVGVPSWMLNYLRNRRIKKFVLEFPGAIDVIVRGVKAGLPLGDCFRVVATETAEPVRGEFVKIVEAQSIGMTMGEAVDRFASRVPVSEVAFFAIVINMQQKAGGNLSESLSNLSSVLRDRRKMKEKVKAISSEAKASAGIIGSLPFLVAGVVYFTNPDYIMLLFTTPTGNLIVAGSLFWMSIGAFMMHQMINFDF